jgi:hypothetical protein
MPLGYEKALSEALISQKYFVPLWEEIQLLEEDEGVYFIGSKF